MDECQPRLRRDRPVVRRVPTISRSRSDTPATAPAAAREREYVVTSGARQLGLTSQVFPASNPSVCGEGNGCLNERYSSVTAGPAAAPPRSSEMRRQASAKRSGKTGGDIGIAVGVDEVGRVEEILDVDLQSQILGQAEEHGGIRSGIPGKSDGVVNRGEHVGSIEHT